jgi:hypothetical protein
MTNTLVRVMPPSFADHCRAHALLHSLGGCSLPAQVFAVAAGQTATGVSALGASSPITIGGLAPGTYSFR